MRRLALAAAVLLASLACTPRATLPDAERQRVSQEIEGRARYLRVACYVAPFFGDRSMVLLSSEPLSELDLVETADGRPVAPPPADRVLPPGTPVRIASIEFPTPWLIARRVMMTPRYHPWALLEVPGDTRAHVVVLSQTAATFDEVRAELERVLTPDDPRPVFDALPPEQRDAIRKKELVEGMGPRALEMAWGQPDRKQIDRPAATEAWSWTDGKRRAFLQDDRLVRWEGGR
jgi:hypothetical protein